MRSTSPGRGPYARRSRACKMASSSVSCVMGNLPLNDLGRLYAELFARDGLSPFPAWTPGTMTARESAKVALRSAIPKASRRFWMRRFIRVPCRDERNMCTTRKVFSLCVILTLPPGKSCGAVRRNGLGGNLYEGTGSQITECAGMSLVEIRYLGARKASSDHVSADSSCFKTYRFPSLARTRKQVTPGEYHLSSTRSTM